MNRKEYWNTVYATKSPAEVSWTQDNPEISIQLIKESKIPKSARIIDVGGGDSKLVDYLIVAGFENITVLDISEEAIAKAKNLLGEKAVQVQWIVSDILDYKPQQAFDLWHDRATFHFLTEPQSIKIYKQLTEAFVSEHLIIGTFSKNGPTRCSGLDIQQYDEASLPGIFNDAFKKEHCLLSDHITPFDTVQNFQFCRFKKIISGQ